MNLWMRVFVDLLRVPHSDRPYGDNSRHVAVRCGLCVQAKPRFKLKLAL